ncbi:unnamed protein product [Rotaria sp. Silwood2]|nr:unnamed protein product [Rotaria sp. Silwood2]
MELWKFRLYGLIGDKNFEQEFNQSHEKYYLIIEFNLNAMIKLNYQQNFEQTFVATNNDEQAIEILIN